MFLRFYYAHPVTFLLDNGVIDLDHSQGIEKATAWALDNSIENLRMLIGESPDPNKWYRKTYVYLVKGTSGKFSGCYKIGRTKNPKARMQTLRQAHGVNLERICLIPVQGTYADRELEATLHLHFLGQHIGREWFVLDDADVLSIKSLETL